MEDNHPNRFLEFDLGNEHFAIPLPDIREVIAFPDFRPIPQTPDYFLGIMSLRNEVIPVIDLRIKLSIEPTLTHETSVIVCDLKPVIVGIVVDQIHTVIAPNAAEISEPPQASDNFNTDFLKNVICSDKQLTLVLAISKLLSANDVVILRNNAPIKAAA
jgi:purine-binding chemotaxis protein CheW